MSYKKQCDRTMVIRLNKALLRASESLNNPLWSSMLPTNNEVNKLAIPPKGEKLSLAQTELWLDVAQTALSDLFRNRSNIPPDKYQRHVVEVSYHLQQWGDKTQGPRADGRKYLELYEDVGLGGYNE